jgi:hypothetical protein
VAELPSLDQRDLLPVSMKLKGVEVMLSNDEMAAVIAAVRTLIRNGRLHPEVQGTGSFQNCCNVLQKLDLEVDPAFGRGILHD